MKNNKLLILLAIALSIFFFAFSILSSNGRAGYTNSPGEANCTSCHGSFPVNSGAGSVTITSNIPGWSYCPGQTYTINVTVAQSGFSLFGLDVEALSGTSTYANAGTFVITNTETTIKTFTVSSVVRNNVTHTGTGNNTANTHTFSFNWVAPATNVGNVTFYVSGMAANGTGGTSGDYTYTTSQVVTPATQVAASVSISASSNPICAGTAVTFTATPVNGGTTPAYQWKLNGANTGTNSPTYSNAALANGNVVSCVMTSNASCVSGSPATSNSITMTVNPNVTASISIAASSNPVCAGTPVTFTATPINGGTTPAYQWKLNGVNAGTNSPTYSNAVLANGDVISCIMTSDAACVSGSPATSNSVTMTVNPNVSASISIAASSNPVCAGTPVTFTATPVNGGTTPVYQWKLNGVNTGTNSPTYSNSTLANGNVVSCVMTSNASCVSGSPATSNSITMTVNPVVAASVSIAASSNPVCSGTSVTFTATPVNGGITPVYQWKLNGVNAGTNSPTFTNAAPVNGDIIVCEMTSDVVCANPLTATSNTITMVVNGTLAPSVSIAASANPACTGTNVTFTATPINGGTTPSYQWLLNGVNAGANNPVYSNSALVNGDLISCVMTSNLACANPATATSNIITMVITSSLTPSVSIAATSNPICAGTSVTFSASPVNGGDSPIYQWQLNGVNVGSNSSTYSSSTLVNGDQIICALNSDMACANPSNATSNTITMSVTALVTPTDTISASSNPICSGQSVTFNSVTTNEGTSPAYQWQVNGSNTGTNNPVFTSSALANGDVVTCILNSNQFCAFPASVTSNAVTMTVNPLLTTPVITQIGNTLNSSASSGNQWYMVPSLLISGATSQTYSPVASGDYFVVVTDAHNCGIDTSAVFHFILTGISVLSTDNGFTVYPNPTTGKFSVRFNSALTENVKMKIFNSLGNEIMHKVITEQVTTIDAGSFATGIYFIQIQNSDGFSHSFISIGK